MNKALLTHVSLVHVFPLLYTKNFATNFSVGKSRKLKIAQSVDCLVVERDEGTI